MRIEEDVKLDFSDVLIRPKRSSLASRNDVDITRSFKFRHSNQQWGGVPIIAANMDTTGTFEMARALDEYGMMVALHKHYSVEEYVNFFSEKPYTNAWYSMGMTDRDYDKLCAVASKVSIRRICIDVANGYQEPFVEFVKRIRELSDECQYDWVIMAGNVVTPDMTEALIIAGADVVKGGIGGGSVCTTRTMTGVGYPQLSTVIEMSDAAHGLGGLVCSDGGCTLPSDIAKAFGGGADFVMLGGMLAAHYESGGELEIEEETEIYVPSNEKEMETYNGLDYIYSYPDSGHRVDVYGKAAFKTFYGMSSSHAMGKYSGGVASYRTSEGKLVKLPYRGPVKNTVREILGGMRSMMTYIGASKLKEVPKRTTFVRVNRQKNDIFGRD